MNGYLTNVNLDERIKLRVETAAKKSGMNVEYRDHPMPNKAYGYRGYDAAQHVGRMGSIFTHEGSVDHSRFWEEYELTKI